MTRMGGRVVWVAPVVSGLLLAVTGVIRFGADLPNEHVTSDLLPNAVLGLTMPLLGAAVLRQLPGHLLGRLWVFTGLAAALTLTVHSYAQLATSEDGWPLPVASAWVASWLWVFGFTPFFTLGLLLFPTGRLPSRRWWFVLVLPVLAVVLPVLGQAVRPGRLEGMPVENPLGWRDGPAELMSSVGFVCFSIAAAIGAAAVVHRWRTGGAADRDRLALPALSAGVLGATFLVPTVDALVPWLDALVLLEVVVLLAAFAVAVLRDRITGAQVVVRRSLTYGLLTGLLAVAFAGVVAALSLLSDDRSTDLVASVVTALLALPLRDRLQAVVDRSVYGERTDPFAALDRMGQRIDSADDPQSVLLGVAEAVATILRLPSVRVLILRDGVESVAAAVGPEVESWTRLPLRHGGEDVGVLLVAPRTGQAALDPRDVRMLEALQRQAGSAVASVRLGVELQQSRQRIIAAREEERRRLRRDLHDGLGPTLAGIGLGLEVAKASDDPEVVENLLASLKDEAAAAVLDVRRLVEDLRPPALDELGLVGALRRHADRLNLGETSVEVVAEDALSGLPAAVEVAAYRIAMEALTNAVRHGRPRHCAVRLSVDDALQVVVTDDGVGLPERQRAGVGLVAMRERAAELGGTCTIARSDSGGTTVLARLPVQAR
jgi:signal transduction histidine kinase